MLHSSVSHQPGSGLPQKGLEVSSSHQLQQDEPRHSLQADSYTPHYVLVAELAAGTQQGNQGSEMALLAVYERQIELIVCVT